MKYIIAIVFATALLPGVGGNISLGFFYLTPLRLAILLLPVVFVGEKVFHIRQGNYCLKSLNLKSIMFMLIWFLYSLLTVFWCKDLASWQHGEYFIFIGMWTMIFFDMSDLKEKDFIDILKCVQLVMVIHNFLGWYEVVTHKYLFATEERVTVFRNAGKYYPVSTMTNQNDFIMVLIFGICLSILFLVTSKKCYFKIFNFLLLLSNIVLGILTDSRLGIVGIVIALTCFAVFLLPRKYKRHILGAGIVLAALSIIVFPHLYLKIPEVLADIEGLDFTNPSTNSDAVRLNLIKNGLVYLKETYGFGVGTGNADYWLQMEPVYNVRGFTNMHNWWAEILTNFGIIIFLLYIAFFFSLLYSLYRKYKISSSFYMKMISIVMVAFMVAFIITSMSSSSNWGKEWLWILWAFIIAFQGSSSKNLVPEPAIKVRGGQRVEKGAIDRD